SGDGTRVLNSHLIINDKEHRHENGAQILTYPSAFTKHRGEADWEVVDPWGKILLDMNLDSPLVRTIDIDLGYIEQVREKMPIIQHRQRDLYKLISPTTIIVPIDDKNEEKIRCGQLEIRINQIFFRSTLTLAFVNKKSVVFGHVVVSPFRCVERFSQLNPE
ncbi:unnamed protein product, partial [Rotaria sordida]